VNLVVCKVPISYVVPLTLSISTLGCLFQVAMTLDAYRIKNNAQIFLQCIFNTCLSVLTVCQYIFIKDANGRIHVSPGLVVCAAVLCVCSATMYWLAFALHREYAWAIYQHINPDRETSNRYFTYQIYLVILKFTPFFLIAFVITYGLIDVHYNEPEFSLTMAIIPLALLNVALAVFAIRKESRGVMAAALTLQIAEAAYLVSRLAVLYGKSLRARTIMKEEMVFFALMALLFAIAATGVGCACVMNFGKSLKPFLQVGASRQEPELSDTAYHLYPVDANDPLASQRTSRRFILE
ncbi:hypothetical protein C7974DRAFT_322330, partial [Boeremia exigua]|uniref:uncharacterized protein n=1 Tax=Boeremia exigua TaxID=749465 RepID=UPI001E8DE863